MIEQAGEFTLPTEHMFCIVLHFQARLLVSWKPWPGMLFLQGICWVIGWWIAHYGDTLPALPAWVYDHWSHDHWCPHQCPKTCASKTNGGHWWHWVPATVAKIIIWIHVRQYGTNIFIFYLSTTVYCWNLVGTHPELFSGWGLRTSEARANLFARHVGLDDIRVLLATSSMAMYGIQIVYHLRFLEGWAFHLYWASCSSCPCFLDWIVGCINVAPVGFALWDFWLLLAFSSSRMTP